MSESMITVGIPFHNDSLYLDQSIRSVFTQPYNNWCLILIDDGSTDGSLEIAKRYAKDPRVTIVSDGSNKKLAKRLNQIIDLAKTKYIARMDADDIMHTSRLEEQFEIMELNPDIDVLGSNAISIDENNNIISTSLSKARQYDFKRIIMHKFDLPAPTQLVRLQSLKDVGGYEPGVVLEDWYMWLKLAKHGSIYYMSEVFALYRQHNSNMSKNSEKMQQGRLDVLSFFKDSEHYNKAVANIKWFNNKQQYESNNHEMKYLLRMFSRKPFKTANYLFKRAMKRVKLSLK